MFSVPVGQIQEELLTCSLLNTITLKNLFILEFSKRHFVLKIGIPNCLLSF